uniref:TonB-dependent receptor n=2 Tax=Candidatus Electrothrix sp. TaxID=2170559 RepID=UPI004056FB0F
MSVHNRQYSKKVYNSKILITLTAVAMSTPIVTPDSSAYAENTKEMPEVLVSGEKLITPTRQASETVYTGSEITSKGIEIQGTKATTSVYNTLDMLSGINVESADSNGLAAEMSSVRVRGVKSALGALTVEGVPNYGGNPIGPRDYLYDMENMEAVSVYKGAVPGDIGTGVGSRGGAVELRPDWPHEDFGVAFKQGLGSNAYTRTYLRLDSGAVSGTGTAFSGSFSYAESDKWRGEGSLGPRFNGNIAMSQPFGEKTMVKLWYNHNDLEQHLYRALSWDDIQDLGANYDKGFTNSLTGKVKQDIYYYDYNRGTYQNDDLMAVLESGLTDTLSLNLKPYTSREDVAIFQGMGKGGGMIRKRIRDIERTGLIGEAVWETMSMKTTAGYHFEAADMSIYSQKYVPVKGGGMAYRGYGRMASRGTTYINSPYFKLAGTHDIFSWQVGLKYFHFQDADSQGYMSGPGPDYALQRTPDLDREATEYDTLLPTVAASSQITDAIELRAGYGKTFIRPYKYMPLVNLYSANRTTFQAQGMNLQTLFDGYNIEETHTVDLGLRYVGAWFDLSPTLFYSTHSNLVCTIYDPRVNLNYDQFVGEATGYGLDMEMNAYLNDELTLFLNPTYTTMSYDNDLTYAGSTLEAEGNQVVDTPEWLVKAGLIWHSGSFEIVPMLRYIGSRYSDLENRDEVDAATVVDLRMSYTLPNILKTQEMKLSLELNNLLDEEYISSINAMDDSMQGEATYYPGTPFSGMLTLSVKY